MATLSLPQAIREKLICLFPESPPVREAEDDLQRRRAAMLWGHALAAPFIPDRGAVTCDAMAPVALWPHQRRVVTEVAGAWPAGRLLCDEVGMGKTVEAILVLRRASAIALHSEAVCVDGLDPRQWTLLRQLQRPGERLPLLLVSAESDAFKTIRCRWVGPQGRRGNKLVC